MTQQTDKRTGKTRVTLFLDPKIAHQFAVMAVEQNTDRSTLVTQWIQWLGSPAQRQTADATPVPEWYNQTPDKKG